ncbi:MAG: Aspartokinase I/homoserine dehydrogenase, partial [Pseudomonadota bacterium]
MTVSHAADWVVHKFGGSSVADADCFRRVAAILKARSPGRLAVVLSACKGVTDELIDAVHAAATGADSRTAIAALRARHTGLAGELLQPSAAKEFVASLEV